MHLRLRTSGEKQLTQGGTTWPSGTSVDRMSRLVCLEKRRLGEKDWRQGLSGLQSPAGQSSAQPLRLLGVSRVSAQ